MIHYILTATYILVCLVKVTLNTGDATHDDAGTSV